MASSSTGADEPSGKALQPRLAPEANMSQNQPVMVKLGQLATSAVQKYKLYDKPICVKPHEIGVSPNNRGKSAPNVNYIVNTLHRNILDDSFDTDRLLPGICIQYKDPQTLKNMLEWNQSFTTGSSLFPPVRADKMNKGSLACSHTNMMLRLIDSGKLSAEHDEKLAAAVSHGHYWWVLSDDCPEECQRAISEWRNADNNQNCAKHEIENEVDAAHHRSRVQAGRHSAPWGGRGSSISAWLIVDD
jgi:hypothetical protein